MSDALKKLAYALKKIGDFFFTTNYRWTRGKSWRIHPGPLKPGTPDVPEKRFYE